MDNLDRKVTYKVGDKENEITLKELEIVDDKKGLLKVVNKNTKDDVLKVEYDLKDKKRKSVNGVVTQKRGSFALSRLVNEYLENNKLDFRVRPKLIFDKSIDVEKLFEPPVVEERNDERNDERNEFEINLDRKITYKVGDKEIEVTLKELEIVDDKKGGTITITNGNDVIVSGVYNDEKISVSDVKSSVTNRRSAFVLSRFINNYFEKNKIDHRMRPKLIFNFDVDEK